MKKSHEKSGILIQYRIEEIMKLMVGWGGKRPMGLLLKVSVELGLEKRSKSQKTG